MPTPAERATRFSCVRYGNVVGSRGSVVPLFLKQRQNGKLTITDERMTRFWLTLEQGVRFVIRCIEADARRRSLRAQDPQHAHHRPGQAIAPKAELEVIGIRPGEKLHEVLIHEDEARVTVELDDMFVVQPTIDALVWARVAGRKAVPCRMASAMPATPTRSGWYGADPRDRTRIRKRRRQNSLRIKLP